MVDVKIARLLFVSVSVALILSMLGTITAIADENPPGGVPTPSAESADPDNGSGQAPGADEPPGGVPTPSAESADPNNGSGQAPGAGEPPHSSSADILEDIHQSLPENTSIVVIVDQQVEPLATQQAANAFVTGDPIWCPEGASPVPGVGGCTASYGNLLSLINDIYNTTIPEPASNGVIWITSGTDTSASGIYIDGASLPNWADVQLTLQGGWAGDAAGTITGTSVFTVPISITDWDNNLTINQIVIDGSGALGLEIDTAGDIALSDVSSNGNSGGGAELYASGDVTLTGVNQFDNNLFSGLYIDAGGNVEVENVTADDNGWGGAELVASGNVSLQGTNNFNGNGLTGLLVDSGGAISAENITAGNNGGEGADLASFGGAFITGANVFNSNTFSGLSINSGGSIAAENISASGNGNDGAVLISAGGLSLQGTNVFNGNYYSGLYTSNGGDIQVENVEASNNGVSGFYGSGAEFFSMGMLTLTGANSFNSNHSDGLYVDVAGNIFVQNADALSNGWSGIFLAAPGDASLTCGTITGNGALAIDTSLSGTLTLNGVNFGGLPDNEIGIDPSQLALVSNHCFTYPDYGAGEGGGGGGTAALPFSEFPPLGIKYFSGVDGQTINLNCDYFGGTHLFLSNGDGVYVPCPITDNVRLLRVGDADFPAPLPTTTPYVSGMDILIVKDGMPVKALDFSNVIWFKSPDLVATAGYQASYWDGQEWVDVTDDIHPFMTMFFLIPDGVDNSSLAVMYWDGQEWAELTGGSHLGDGKIVQYAGQADAEVYYKASVNFIGTFVLVEKTGN